MIIYMPMVPEAAVSNARVCPPGRSTLSGVKGFAANELATRIDDAKPKVVVSASCGVEVKRIIPVQTSPR